MKENRRKAIPWRVKAEAALRELGFTIEEVEFDHDPPLALRAWDEENRDTVPPANDSRYIRVLRIAAHKQKTTGRKGESKVAPVVDGDIHKIAKTRRLAKETDEFRSRLLAREPGERRKPRGRIRSRPFPKKRPSNDS